MSRPHPSMNRTPPQNYNAPRERRGPPPSQHYDDAYQQDWNQGGYDGYGQQGGYNDHGYNQAQYNQNGNYDSSRGGYDGGYQESYPKQRSSQDRDRRRGPPPPGMRGPGRGPPHPQQGGSRSRGPPRDPYAQGRPPQQDPRSRARSQPRPRDDRYYDRASAELQQGYNDQYDGASQDPRQRQPASGRPQYRTPQRPDPGYGQSNGYDDQYYDGNMGYGVQPGQSANAEDRHYSNQSSQQQQYPARQASQAPPGARNRAPMPQFQSVKQRPIDPRPDTATGVRSPPPRPQMPPQSQTVPSTPIDGAFSQPAVEDRPFQSWQRLPPTNQTSVPQPTVESTLPIRPGPGPTAASASEDMPNFETSSPINGAYQRPAYQPTPANAQQTSQPPEQRFEMPGDTPAYAVGGPIANGYPQNTGLPARPQTAGSQNQPSQWKERGPMPQRSHTAAAQTQRPQGQEQGRPAPIRQMMNDSYQNDPRAQYNSQSSPAPQSYNGQDQGGRRVDSRAQQTFGAQPPPPSRQDSSFSDQSVFARPRTPGGSRPNTAGVERPNFYPAMDTFGPQDRRGSATGSQRSGPQSTRPLPNGYQNGRQPAPQPNGVPSNLAKEDSQHRKQGSDALPHHPTPVRPRLESGNSGDNRPKPAPVRQYSNTNRDVNSAGQVDISAPPPVTQAELSALRNDVARLPSDYKTRLLLAKKLVEMSQSPDDGGRVDQQTRMLNQQRYIKEARDIVRKLVDAKYPDAMFYLADAYGAGVLGVLKDAKEAFSLYQAAAKLNHPAAAYRTAVCCEIGVEEGGGTKRDYQKAVQWFKRAANLGDVPSAFKLGMILMKGLLDQQPNMAEAVSYLRKAAERADEENPHAVHELAQIYESNHSAIPKNEAESIRLYTQAGKLGYKFSQLRLGQAYEHGILTAAVDARTSIIWYTKGAAQGEHECELALSGWYLTGAEGILEHSDTEAYLWARKAASADPPLPKAMFAMGYFTEVGIGCPRSLDEAKRWYGRAAVHNFPKARERLDELRRGGAKVQKNREKLSRQDQKKTEENCVVM